MRTKTLLLILIASFICAANAQKVKVGYDKSVDFGKYRTYSWTKIDPSTITMRRAAIIGEVDAELKKKGLELVNENGDLLLSGSGGTDFEAGGAHTAAIAPTPSSMVYPTAGVWAGVPYAPGSIALGGTLMLEFTDRATNKLVWEGSVATKIDTDNRTKNFDRVRAGIIKLLDRYPPKK